MPVAGEPIAGGEPGAGSGLPSPARAPVTIDVTDDAPPAAAPSDAGTAPDVVPDRVPDVVPTPGGGRVPLTAAAAAPGGIALPRREAFQVHLDVYEGPFDLLLGLIGKHKLDVTEIALAKVTDEFIGYIRSHEHDWDLGQASEFLLVAATLLDLKAARLLPAAEVEDDEDLALLEARDLLFARLLQYRAFKDVSATLSERMAAEGRRRPRAVSVEPHFAQLLPELVLGITPEQLAMIAAKAMIPKAPPLVGLDHLHAPAVSVREQATIIVDRLRRTRSASFRVLIADADATLVVVARFLALLELFREGAVAFDQAVPLGDLTVRWTGADDGDFAVDEFEGDPDKDPVDEETADKDPVDEETVDEETADEDAADEADDLGEDGRDDG